MGDIIGSIFGTSSTQTQKTVPDAVQQAINLERLNQIIHFFQGQPISQFSGAQPGIYSPTSETEALIKRAGEVTGSGLDYSNIPTLDQYRAGFDPVSQEFQRALGRTNQLAEQQQDATSNEYEAVRQYLASHKAGGLQRSYGDYATGIDSTGRVYSQVGGDLTARYNSAIARGDYDLARSLMTNESYANRALNENTTNFDNIINLTRGTANQAGDVNEANYLRSLGIADTDANRAVGANEASRQRALELGIGATGNYISQIATPRINQAMALQGLESGGAVPSAIARATAETAMPYLQGIETSFGGNQATILNNLLSLKAGLGSQMSAQDAALLQQLLSTHGQLGGQFMGLQGSVNTQLAGQQAAATGQAQQANAALGSQLMSLQGSAGTSYQNNINQLAQSLMANNISLEQAGISAESAIGQQLMNAQNSIRLQQQQSLTSLGGTYVPLEASFAQSIPQAASAISMLPIQMRAGQAATIASLAPLSDFSRQLKEQDYLRRQGLFQTVYTGLPFQPGSTTAGSSGTGNIFDQLGGTISSGVTGGSGGFSTLGTKT